MTVTRDPIAVPDSTAATFSLLRELRRGRGRKQAASAAYWAYLIAIIVVGYGGSLIVTTYRALRNPPPATAAAPRLLHAGPAALTALALLVFLVLLRDALWRGPVTVSQATADWRYRVGWVPVSGLQARPLAGTWLVAAPDGGDGADLAGHCARALAAGVALGLGGGSGGEVLRLAGAAMLSMGLLFAVATGVAGLIERYPGTGRQVRAATPVVLAAAVVLGGLAAWAGLGRLPGAVATVLLWSGRWPWGCSAGPRWPRWPARTGPWPGCPPPRCAPGPAPSARCPRPR